MKTRIYKSGRYWVALTVYADLSSSVRAFASWRAAITWALRGA